MRPEAPPAGHPLDTGGAERANPGAMGGAIFDWLLRVLALAAIAAAFLVLAGFATERVVVPDDIRHSAGHAYEIDLRPANSLLTPRSLKDWSAARPTEDGRQLGPDVKRRQVVADEGGGRFVHQRDTLYFSTSDNSDPRSNGRRYRIAYRLHVKAWLAGLLWLALALGLYAAARRAAKPVAVADVVERLVFGLPARTLRRSVGAVLALIALVLAASDRQVAYGLASGIGELTGILVFLALCLTAGFILARAVTTPGVNLLRAMAQALVMLCLAMGLQRAVLSPAQLIPLAAGVLAWAIVRRRPAWHDAVEHWIARLVQVDAGSAAPLVRRIVLLSMAVCLLAVLPYVIRFWDQSGWMDSGTYDALAQRIATGALPAGSSRFMPLYQYGLATFYWAFGHFFFVQQVVNVVLAVLGAGLVSAAAWLLFRQPFTALLAGLVAAVWKPLHHATWTTQIEGWYVPLFALSVFMLLHYLERRSLRALLLLAFVAALIFNMRLQGAFYAAALGFAVLFAADLPWRARLRQLMAFGLVFLVIGVLPWSVRNWAVEGRFSPSSAQSVSALAVYNDPRIPLYGIRYWENSGEVAREWAERYPDAKERLQAQRQYFYDRLFNDTHYFVAAAPWRLMAFYGLLPPGALAKEGPRATDWVREGWAYAGRRARFWAPVAISLLGWLATIGSRLNVLFAGLIAANVIVAFSTGFSEPRLAYPVAILHLLMGCAVFAGYAVDLPSARGLGAFRSWGQWLAGTGLALLLILPLAHVAVGGSYGFRPVMAEAWMRERDVAIDRRLPVADARGDVYLVDGKEVQGLTVGSRYRGKFLVENRMHSPRWICCRNDFIRRIGRSDGVTYFYAWFKSTDDSRGMIALRFTGTRVVAPIREGSIIEAEIRVDAEPADAGYPARFWAHVESAVVVRLPGG